MHRFFCAPALLLGLFTAHTAAAQEFECLALLEALRVEPVSILPAEGNWECLEIHGDVLQINVAALNRSDNISDISEVYGTWLGDDVLLPLTGLMTSGQEVLQIGPGPNDQTVTIRQYWYKATRQDQSIPWDSETGYTGLVSQGALSVQSGGYFSANFANGYQYFSPQLHGRRTNQLYVLSQLNHFGHTGTFLRDGDTLIIESERLNTPMEDTVLHHASFTRVSDQAPDMALLLVRQLRRDPTRYFDCFAHQITDGSGPLIDAMSPYSIDEALSVLTRGVDIQLRRNAFYLEENPQVWDEAAEAALLDEFRQWLQNPFILQLGAAFAADSELGCPPIR